MSRAEELILKNKRMMLLEPVLPFAEIQLSWVVKNEDDIEKEVDLLHTYEVNKDEDYVGMQVMKDTCLNYQVDWGALAARVDLNFSDEYYQVRIPIPSYVKVGQTIRLRYSYPLESGEDHVQVADYELHDDTCTVAVIGHNGISTSVTEEDAQEAFIKVVDKTFAL